MSVLDRLYRLEIEFHRLFRGLNALEAAGIHTSYALQNQYEPMLRALGLVDPSLVQSWSGRHIDGVPDLAGQVELFAAHVMSALTDQPATALD